MYVRFNQSGQNLCVELTVDANDRVTVGKAKLANLQASFKMPDGFRLDQTHPDVLGLAAIIVASPWAKETVLVDTAVSRQFADAVNKAMQLRIHPLSDDQRPRTGGRRPALSFSAGVDSTACLEIMPSATVAVFARRVGQPTETTMYRSDAAIQAIEEIRRMGRDVVIVETSLELMRLPVGFSVDPSPGLPSVLLADYLDLDSIGYGTIAEAAYRTGAGKFSDYANRPVFQRWQSAFTAVGLPYYNPVACMSELCTMEICRSSQFGHLAQSCVRGSATRPCGKCVKCFRKSLILARLSGKWPTELRMRRYLSNRSVRDYLSSTPIRLEIVMTEILREYNGHSPSLTALKRRVSPSSQNTEFLTQWYTPGLKDAVPEKYYSQTYSRIESLLSPMSNEDEEQFAHFDINAKIRNLEKQGEIAIFRGWLEKIDISTNNSYLLPGLLRQLKRKISQINGWRSRNSC